MVVVTVVREAEVMVTMVKKVVRALVKVAMVTGPFLGENLVKGAPACLWWLW